MASSSRADRAQTALLRRLRGPLASVLVASGLWYGAEGIWLYAKAALAQQLIAHAWREQLHSGVETRAWPWADTRPVAQLSWPRGEVELIVLEGIQGEALAFGPGLVTSDAVLTGLIIAGHRDTHFRFLAKLQIGDELLLQQRDSSQRYRIEALRVVDSSIEQLQIDSDELVLVTCYPFDAIRAGGPLRYRVSARPLSSSLVTATTMQSSPSTSSPSTMSERFSL